jgi:short-subunit dehydrogenase
MTGQHLAVITGASGGIGQALARALAAAHYSVCLVGRDSRTLQIQRENLAGCYPGVQIYAHQCDVTVSGERLQLIQAVQGLGHPLSVWINNAGTSAFGLFDQQSEECITELLEVNLTAPMLMTQALVKAYKGNGVLNIINIGSTFGSIGYPGFTAYAASKFGLRGFSEALGRELGDSPIRIRYFAPRATKTDLNTTAVNDMNAELGVHMDAPEVVAAAFMRFLRGQKVATHIGFPEKLFVRLNACFPALVTSAISKQLPVIRRYCSLSRPDAAVARHDP